MSEAVFSGLPRFDAGSAGASAPGSWQRSLEAGAGRDAPRKDNTRCETAHVEPAPPEPSPQLLDLKQIEGALAALGGQLARIEREANQQTLQSVQAMAAKLFPALSAQFLAEEISRHLADMVPASAAVVEIRAEAELAEKLRGRVDALPNLAHRCTITPLPVSGQGRVDVSWQSGGLSFDFDGLLAACLSHLKPNASVTRE